MHPSSRVSPAELRPRRRWYLVAGLIAVLGVVAGVGLFAVGTIAAVGGLPPVRHRFGTGERTTVDLTAGRKAVLYVAAPKDAQVSVDCTGTPAPGVGGTITLSRISYVFTVNPPGDHTTWRGIYDVQVTRSGRYQLTCGRLTDGGERQTFGISDDPKIGGFVRSLLGGLAALLGLPCLGVTLGGVLALVVAVRRSSHRARLQRTVPPPG